MLSQLNLNSDATPNDSNKSDFGLWHSVAYFFKKIIPIETRYKTHDAELLAIVKGFKIWCHYLEGCKHEVFVLTDYNNLLHFLDTKSLSFCQIRWARSSPSIIFKSTIAKTRPIKLQTLYLASSKEASRKKKSFEPKHLNFSLFAVLLSKSQPSKLQPQLWARLLTALPSPHLRHVRLTTALSVLGNVSN